MIFKKSISNISLTFSFFSEILFVFKSEHYFIELKRQSKDSGLCPDTSTAVQFKSPEKQKKIYFQKYSDFSLPK